MFCFLFVAVGFAGLAAWPGNLVAVASQLETPVVEIDPEVFRPVLVPGGSLISRGIRASESDPGLCRGDRAGNGTAIRCAES